MPHGIYLHITVSFINVFPITLSDPCHHKRHFKLRIFLKLTLGHYCFQFVNGFFYSYLNLSSFCDHFILFLPHLHYNALSLCQNHGLWTSCQILNCTQKVYACIIYNELMFSSFSKNGWFKTWTDWQRLVRNTHDF